MNIWSTLDSSTLINLSILIPLLGAGLLVAAGKFPNLREAITLTTSLLLLSIVLTITHHEFDGQSMSATWVEVFPGISLAFDVEPLGVLFAVVASFLWIVTSVYAIGYMRGHNEENQTRFFCCFALAISSVMAICFSGNLLTLFVFYEIGRAHV